MTLKFSDGMEFDTSGKLRITSRSDSLYVVGQGMLIPISSRKEGNDLIAEWNKEEEEDEDNGS